MHCFVYLKNRAKHGDVMWSYTLNTWNSYRKDLWLILCWVEMLQCEWRSVWEASALVLPVRSGLSTDGAGMILWLSVEWPRWRSPATLLPGVFVISWTSYFIKTIQSTWFPQGSCRATDTRFRDAVASCTCFASLASGFCAFHLQQSICPVSPAYCQNSLWVNKCWGGCLFRS